LAKGYGFVEFSLPSAALKCKEALDKPDAKPSEPKKRKAEDEPEVRAHGLVAAPIRPACMTALQPRRRICTDLHPKLVGGCNDAGCEGGGR
jgi:hypothetical protein